MTWQAEPSMSFQLRKEEAPEKEYLSVPSSNLGQTEPNDLQLVHQEESWGEIGHQAVKLFVMLGRELTKNDQDAINKHMRELMIELNCETKTISPLNIKWKEEWLKGVSDAFFAAGLQTDFMLEIPNEYCGPRCCPHKVWLKVYTNVGIFKVGWRKRVIHLEWTDTNIQLTAKQLFPNEDVTKVEKMIHCYGMEKMGVYIKKLGSLQNAGGG